MPTYRFHERMLELVRAEGVDTLFGIPDPSFFGMFIAAEEKGMTIVSPHHEQAATMMADGYYRMTGKPGVICVNKGPGVANIAGGAIYLAKENIPAVFIMAQRHRLYEHRVRRGMTQHLRQGPLYEGIMKYIGIVEFPEQIDEIFHEAFRIAQSGVPGPTFVEIPLGVMQATLDLPPAPPPHRYRLAKQRAADDMVAEAVKVLKDAKDPVLLVGQGATASRAHTSIAALAKKLACPILNTISIDTVFEGMGDQTFRYGSTVSQEIVARADAVVAIGTEIGEAIHYGRGRHWSKGNTDRKWIYIERDPTAIGVNRPIDIPLVGDLKDVVPQLVDALGSLQRKASPDLAKWAAADTEEKRQIIENLPTASKPIHTGRLGYEATKVLNDDTVIIRDGGSSFLWFWATQQTKPKDMMWNSNYGAIGGGIAYAMGAQLAFGNKRRVVLLSGDSSILFHISEIETAVRKNLQIICIVAVDYAWGLEAASYRANFGENTSMPEAQWSRSVRLDKTAESFGAHGEYVDKAEDIGPAVERALASGKPAIIHVVVDAAVHCTFKGLPGFGEFRTWYGEESDNSSPLVNSVAKSQDPPQAAPKDKMPSGSGY
jgi:thiamine pyrophosphate-dependent acetolactate synthase large subunit-like protein